MSEHQETLLRVEHLCQYFGFNRAVDDVSFEIKKGEVFGLVGESGCGKTTTGRSIIKLYNITSGNIYYKGIRISAGLRSYRENISKATSDYNEKVKTASPEQKSTLKAERDAIIAENKQQMKRAIADLKRCDKEYSAKLVQEVNAKYEPLLANATPELKKEYKNELRKAKRARVVGQIQMIFQDSGSALDPRMTVRDIIAEGLIIRGERNKKVIDEKV